ncbi:hypothetical protein BHE74_00030642 [Ensete ventricosum]|nr:hypothetical protein BHE74_00030642 [Ensete ventricosum]
MISLLPLQEFMSLTSVQRKPRASALCSIFYINSLHIAWILHQVSPKLLYPSICIELVVALTPTIQRVSPPLSLISISALSVSLFGITMSYSPTKSHNVSTNALLHARLYVDFPLLARFIEFCEVVVLRCSFSTSSICCT